ncbi:MAG: YbjQ family protein [Gammaproteobacteria bacterium]|nr:YbjQ family protein [Gammaproteobacteria bacterium]
MIDLIILLVLLVVGLVFGQIIESRHYRSIRKREEQFRHLLLVPSRFPPIYTTPPQTRLVIGATVISVDYFKVFVAGLRKLVGGRMRSYESLVDRARREAVLRMKAEAHSHGATMIFNIKFEATPLYKGQRGAIQSIEGLAYGTAIIPARRPV